MQNILKRTRNRLSFEFLLPVFLILISCILSWRSFTPNTFLTGWDTLHPEFNFKNAFEEIIWGVWRSDQGLGTVAAHSHMSELPRLIYLFIASHIVTLNTLRYSYFFLCLGAGPVGMYLFLKRFVGVKTAAFASFVGALYYLLNLGTVQRFSVPFEMFATQFAALPWIIYSAFSYLDTGKKKFIGLFALTSFLGSAQAYAATLFYAYAAIFSLSLFIYFLINRKLKLNFKKYLLVFAVLLATNAYWLLPNLYSIRNQSSEVSVAKINELFTPEAILHNKSYGNFIDVVSQKNYLFGWQAYDFQKNTFVNLLSSWNKHFENRWVRAIPLIFSVMAFGGILVSVLRKNKIGIVFVLPSLICIFFLMNSNGVLSGVYSYLQTHSGLFSEGFRDPFTKFSVIFSFFLSFYTSIFLSFIFSLIRKVKLRFIVSLLLTSILSAALLFLFNPAFKEGLVSPLMRVNIPSAYTELFNFFSDKEGRVAQLPLNSLWGWQYNNWGYQGAGFLWFGIKNPTLVRDFDRWNGNNETFYLEASRAYFSNDLPLFESVLEKHKVHYLVFDTSIFDPGDKDIKSTNTKLSDFLSKSKIISKVNSFSFIDVYQTPFGGEQFDAPKVTSNINADTTYSPVDYVLLQFGTYVSGEQGIWKPFVNFDDRKLNLTRSGDQITFTKKIDISTDSVLTIPNFITREPVLATKLSIKRELNSVTIRFDLDEPKVAVDGEDVGDSPVFMTTKLNAGISAGILSVENNVFNFTNIPFDDNFHDLGSMYVNSTGKTKIQVFSTKAIKNNSFIGSITKKKSIWCSDPSKEAPLIVFKGGFSLESTDQSMCIGDSVTLPTAALFETSFETPKGATSFFCINAEGKNGCVNVLPPIPEIVKGNTKSIYQTPLDAGNFWFAFVGQSGDKGKKSIATFANVDLRYYPQVARTQLDFGSAFGLFVAEKNINVKKGQNISVTISAPSIISENFLQKRGHPEAVNCEISNKGTVLKEFSDKGVTYSAENEGVSCDYFDYPQLLQTQAYIMTITGKNNEGRSIKFYLQNRSTNHMEMEELLPNSEFSKDFVLYPYESGSGGFVINLETRAFENINSSNTISAISFAPIPFKWMSEIAIGPNKTITKNNNLVISSSKKIGLYYKVNVTGEGILEVNQSFEKGWLALSDSRKVLKHVIVNGWENGWEVPEGTKSVTIFYVPQILEWVGLSFLILLISTGVVTAYNLKKRV